MVIKITDVIIIGAGPAGIACAIQLKRYNIDSVVLEKGKIGGLLRNANLVENYLGFPNGISGIKLVQLLNLQSQIAEINVKHENVKSVESNKNDFIVKTNRNIYHSRYLVIASGTKPIVPGFPIISEDAKNYVFFDIYKLGSIRNNNIAIIGAGDCAFDYALNLSNKNKVIILNRSNRISVLPILQKRVLENDNIVYTENIAIQEIETINKRLNLILKNTAKSILIDYLLIAIGREPNLDFISKDIMINPKVYQIGDVKNGPFRQTSIAAGDGTSIAMKISKLLNQED